MLALDIAAGLSTLGLLVLVAFDDASVAALAAAVALLVYFCVRLAFDFTRLRQR
jgi:hypothetical protein